jgi:hypothetical protein
MNREVLIAVSAASILASTGVCNAAGSDAGAYSLKEKCMSTAALWFVGLYGNGRRTSDDNEYFSSYQNHYNSKSQKCIVMVTTIITKPKTAEAKSSKSEWIDLVDILENRDIGRYAEADYGVIAECFVAKRDCISKAEWKVLARPHMED